MNVVEDGTQPVGLYGFKPLMQKTITNGQGSTWYSIGNASDVQVAYITYLSNFTQIETITNEITLDGLIYINTMINPLNNINRYIYFPIDSDTPSDSAIQILIGNAVMINAKSFSMRFMTNGFGAMGLGNYIQMSVRYFGR